MDNTSRAKMMGEGDIPKVLMKLAIPGIVAMLISAIYNMVDTIFVGMLNDTNAIAAVSVAFPLFMLIAAFGQMFGVGAASYISRLLGEKNKEQADRTASTTFYTALVVSIVFTVIGVLLMKPILTLFGADASTMPYADGYGRILMLGAVFTIMNMTMNNMIRAEGNAKFSMIAISLGAILNIVLDPVFMFGFNMGIEGAAVATVIGQGISTVFLASYYFSGKSVVKVMIRKISPSIKMYSEIMKIGLATLARQALASLSMGMINSAAKVYGPAAVASMGVSLRVFAMSMYIVFGFNQGFQPIAGYNYGAKKYHRLKEVLSLSVKITSIFCTVVAVLFMVFSQPIIGLFSQDPDVIATGSKALRALSLLLPFFGFQCIYASLFAALGKGKEAFVLSLARQGIFLIPAVIILPNIWGLDGIIYTQTVADFCTLIVTALLAIQISKQLKKESELIEIEDGKSHVATMPTL